MTSSKTNYLSKIPPPNTITLGIKAAMCEFGGTQSITGSTSLWKFVILLLLLLLALTVLGSVHIFYRMPLLEFSDFCFMIRQGYGFGKDHGGRVPFSSHHVKTTDCYMIYCYWCCLRSSCQDSVSRFLRLKVILPAHPLPLLCSLEESHYAEPILMPVEFCCPNQRGNVYITYWNSSAWEIYNSLPLYSY